MDAPPRLLSRPPRHGMSHVREDTSTMSVTPATIRVAPRPRVTVTHNERTPLSQTIGSAVRYV